MANESQPFHKVIFDICAKQVIPVDMKDDKDIDLIKMLCNSSLDALHNIQEKPIMAKRPNEVGNKIEPYIQNAINSYDKYHASKPLNKSAGYPDLIVKDNAYIECKTYNREKINVRLRTFYFSPSEDFKVKYDARHIVVSMEMEEISTGKYIANAFKIIDIYNLQCNLKLEWNSDNKNLYGLPVITEYQR